MTKPHWIAIVGVLATTVFISVIWHITLFEQQYPQLGVYTRMDNPIYAFGIATWLMGSIALAVIFFQTNWRYQGLKGALTYATLMAVFAVSSTLMGAAAKIDIPNLALWFALGGSSPLLHFSLLGLMLAVDTKSRK
ncbi:MAG: hypothetical protein AAGC70_06315 [Pseudomonadota bacterium]